MNQTQIPPSPKGYELRRYGLAHVIPSLAELGTPMHLRVARKILTKYAFLHEKLRQAGLTIEDLLTDFDFLDGADLGTIRDSLQLASIHLKQNPEQLPAQLMGRLHGWNTPIIEQLLEEAEASGPALWPCGRSLTPPGGPFRQTLTQFGVGINDMVLGGEDDLLAMALPDHSLRLLTLANKGNLEVLKTPEPTDGELTALALSEDKTTLLCGNNHGQIWVWDLKSRTSKCIPSGHRDYIGDLILTPDERFFLTASRDGTVKVWCLEKMEEVVCFNAHHKSVNAVALLPNDTWAVSGSSDGIMRVWDWTTGKQLFVLEGHLDAILDMDVSDAGDLIVSCSEDRTIRLWDVKGSEIKERKILTGHTDAVNRVVITKGGKYVISCADDFTIRIWNLESGCSTRILRGHGIQISALVLSKDERKLISATIDGRVRVWNVSDKESASSRSALPEEVFALWTDCHTSLALVDGGLENRKKAYVGPIEALKDHEKQDDQKPGQDFTVDLWRLQEPVKLSSLAGHDHFVRCASFSSNGKFAVTGSQDNVVRIYNLIDGHLDQVIQGHDGTVVEVAFSPDRKWLATAAYDNFLRVYDLKQNQIILAEQLERFPRHLTFKACEHSGLLLAMAIEERVLVQQFQGTKFKLLMNIPVKWCMGLAFATHRPSIVICAADDTLQGWDYQVNQRQFFLDESGPSLVGLECLPSMDAFLVIQETGLSIRNLSDGKVIAAFGVDTNLVHAAICQKGDHLLASDADGNLHFLRYRL